MPHTHYAYNLKTVRAAGVLLSRKPTFFLYNLPAITCQEPSLERQMNQVSATDNRS